MTLIQANQSKKMMTMFHNGPLQPVPAEKEKTAVFFWCAWSLRGGRNLKNYATRPHCAGDMKKKPWLW